MRTFQGRWLTDLSAWLINSCGHMSTNPPAYTQATAEVSAQLYHPACRSQMSDLRAKPSSSGRQTADRCTVANLKAACRGVNRRDGWEGEWCQSS